MPAFIRVMDSTARHPRRQSLDSKLGDTDVSSELIFSFQRLNKILRKKCFCKEKLFLFSHVSHLAVISVDPVYRFYITY
jgi:hypothetical protein